MFRLTTFGGLSLATDAASDVAVPRRRLALLALLASAGERGLTRDKLIAYLWPDSSSDDARHSLEQLVYAIRRQLGAPAVMGTDPLRLNADIISSDVAAFEDGLRREADDAAVAAYGGPFLDGFYIRDAGEFERWVDEERARLSAAYGAALERLAERSSQRSDWPRAVMAWRDLVALDRLSARYTLGLVRALAAAGDRPEALRTAAAHESLVRHELGIPLEPQIATYVQTLRTVSPRAPDASTEDVRAPSPESQRRDDTTPALEAPLPDAAAFASARPPVRRSRVARMLILGVPVLLGVVWLTLVTQSRTRASAAHARQRVVVTVFENRTGDSALDKVGVMTADYTRIALARTGLLDVVAPAFDLWQLENARPANRPTLATLLRQTGATIVVRGAYYREGDSLLFTGQGIDAKSETLIFAFDSVKTSVMAQREASEQVRQHVTSALATHVDPALTPWAGHEGRPPIRFDAYQEFADGMTNFVSGIAGQSGPSGGAARFAAARTHLERAFRLDSTYYIAALWWFWSRYNVGDRPGADSLLVALEPRRRSMSAYERALYDYNVALIHGTPEQRYQLDRQLLTFAPGSEFLFCLARDALQSGHPHEALDVLKTLDDSYSWVRLMRPPPGFRVRALVQQGDNAQAAEAARRIHENAPGDLTSAYPAVDALAALGRLDEVEAVVEHFSETAPNDANAPNLMLYAGLRLQAAGRGERAAVLFGRALAAYDGERASAMPTDVVLFGRARSFYYLARWDSARATFERLANVPSGTSRYDRRALLFLGSLAARRGDAAAVSQIRRLLQTPTVNPAIVQYFEARVAAVRGQHESALKFLAAAVSLGAQAEEFVMEGDAAPSMDPDFAAVQGSLAFRTALGRW